MKAVQIRLAGSSAVLEVRDVERPAIKDDEVLVRVHASAVNPVDLLYRSRLGRLAPALLGRRGRIPGSDLAGTIESVGEDVKAFKQGDEVYGFGQGGATAEYIAISRKRVAIKPANTTFAQAAAIPLAALTALQALRDKGCIQSGHRVLVNGASGGVGTFAVQIAKSFGAKVTGVSSGKNLELVKSLGADTVIDYTETDFTASGESFDIILDAVAKSSFSKCKNILNQEGTYISTRFPPKLLLQQFITTFIGGKRARTMLVSSNTADLDTLRVLVEDGKLRPIIDRDYPLSRTGEAHSYVENGHTKGKVVIVIDPGEIPNGSFRIHD